MSMRSSMRLFASHDWGKDSENHKRVAQVVSLLRELGFTVWFDEDEMKGNLLDDMCEGINKSDAMLVFITKNYLKKVASGDDQDNVRREFMYGHKMLGAARLIPIRFDPELPKKWTGPLGMLLGERLYADLTGNIDSSKMQGLVRLLPTTLAPLRRAQQMACKMKVANEAKKGFQNLPGRSSPPPARKELPTCVIASPLIKVDIRTRVNHLCELAGITLNDGDHTHMKIERLMQSIGLNDLPKDMPFHEKIKKIEEQLGTDI